MFLLSVFGLRTAATSEDIYGPDTMAFKPEQFVDAPDVKDPAAGFGFGRR
jgi:hypothetical protein